MSERYAPVESGGRTAQRAWELRTVAVGIVLMVLSVPLIEVVSTSWRADVLISAAGYGMLLAGVWLVATGIS